MAKWEEKRLGEVCEIITRGITPQYSQEGICVVSQKCVRNNSVDLSLSRKTSISTPISLVKFLKTGDVLVNSTGTGTLGRTGILRKLFEKTTVDGHVTIVRANKRVINYYLGYFLHSIENIIENLGKGSTNQMELSTSDVRNIKIKLPDLRTQERIADILSSYDDLIENNNRRIEILEQSAQALYKEWFVRFRFPNHENTKFINGLPQGWEVKKLRDYGRVETGKTPPTAENINYGNDIMFVKTPDMRGNAYIIETAEMLSVTGHKTQSKKLLPTNSIMVSCIGTGGVVGINGAIAHTNQQINSIILIDAKYLEWLYFVCLSLKPTIELYGLTGATMTNLSKVKFENLKVFNPPQELVYLFHENIKESFMLLKQLMLQTQNLKKQRDLLLPRLMSGKLEV